MADETVNEAAIAAYRDVLKERSRAELRFAVEEVLTEKERMRLMSIGHDLKLGLLKDELARRDALDAKLFPPTPAEGR